jgi:outer membrane protein TolC
MFRNAPALRILCKLTIAALLLTTRGMGQDRSPDVRFITLDDAKGRATGAATSNVAQLGINAAKYHRQAAQADYFPKLSAEFLNLHYNKFMGQTIQLFRRQAALPLFGKDETAVALTFVQPVTQLLQVRQAVTIARADEQIARAKGAQLASQISENVERVYFDLLIASRRQTIARKKVEALQNTQQLASTVTLQTRNVVDHAAAFLEASKELVTTDSQVSELTQSLNALIGFAPDTKLVLAVPEPALETISLTQATQQAVTNSPEVVEAEQTLVKARAASKLSKFDYIPAVAVTGGYLNQTQPVIPLLPNDFSFIGVIATYNIFDFGKREKTVSERNTQVQMAEASVSMVKSKVAASVQKTFLDLQRSQKIRDLTRRLAASYQEASIEDTSARASAESEMFQAELDYRSAYTQLKQLVDGP